MKLTVLPVLAIGALALGESSAFALNYIHGSLLLVGSGGASVAAGVTTVVPASPMSVAVGLGDYAVVPTGSLVAVSPFSYTGTGVGAVLQAPVTPEWTITLGSVTYSFDLTALNSAVLSSGTAGAIAVSGSGTAHIAGFLDTPASWSFSGTGTGFNFAIGSQSTSAVPLPDGGSTLLLFGLAVGGIAAIRRSRE